jgi:hypothetical protein
MRRLFPGGNGQLQASRTAKRKRLNAMSRVLAVWSTFLALSFIPSVSTHQDSGLRVRVSIYDVPSLFVSRTIAWGSRAAGGVWGTIIGPVDTTASFPKGAVLLQHKIPQGFGDSEVKEEIGKYMATGCLVPQQIDPGLVGCHEFQFGATTESQEETKAVKVRGVEYHYRLRLTPGEQSGDALPLRVELWMNRYDPRQIHYLGEERVEQQLLDCLIAVSILRTKAMKGAGPLPGNAPSPIAGPPAFGTLIGIASRDNDSQPRRTVYWIAASADKL